MNPEKIPATKRSNIENPEVQVEHFVFEIPVKPESAEIKKMLREKLTRITNQHLDRKAAYQSKVIGTLLYKDSFDTQKLEKELRYWEESRGAFFSPSVFNTVCAEIVGYFEKPKTKVIELLGDKTWVVAKWMELEQELSRLQADQERIDKEKPNETNIAINNLRMNDYSHKISILKNLVKEGKVDSISVASELATDSKFSEPMFNHSFDQVAEYIQSGGKTKLE